jgi:hypothetical protein
VGRWSLLLEQAKTTEFSKWLLAQALNRLAQDILPTKHAFDPHTHDKRAVGYASDVPPEVTAYLKARLPTQQGFARQWLRRKSGNPSAALDINPELVVQYLESQFDSFEGD